MSIVFQVTQLPHELRQWLYMLIWRLIKCDHWISIAEMDALHEAMRWVRKKDMEKLAQKLSSDFPLEPPSGISDEQAKLMWMEIVRVAAVDGKVSLAQMCLIEQAGRVLGFSEAAILKALGLAEKLAKKKLKELLRKPNKANFFRRLDDLDYDPTGQRDLNLLLFRFGTPNRVYV